MTVTPTVARPATQVNLKNSEIHRRQIAEAVNRINQGHFNCTLFVTLDPDVGQTVVTDSRISLQTAALLHPQTANAAAAMPTTFIQCTNGSATISHTNNAQTDRSFTMAMIG